LFSTVLSLVFVPAVFTLIDDVSRFVWHFGRRLMSSKEALEQTKETATHSVT